MVCDCPRVLQSEEREFLLLGVQARAADDEATAESAPRGRARGPSSAAHSTPPDSTACPVQLPSNHPAAADQVVVPRLTSNGLRWLWSGDAQARACLYYRGVIPILAPASSVIGSPDGAIQNFALKHVSV